MSENCRRPDAALKCITQQGVANKSNAENRVRKMEKIKRIVPGGKSRPPPETMKGVARWRGPLPVDRLTGNGRSATRNLVVRHQRAGGAVIAAVVLGAAKMELGQAGDE